MPRKKPCGRNAATVYPLPGHAKQCSATKPNHDRCKNKVAKQGPMCWVHGKTKQGLEIQKSTLANAGCGLYATREFDRGDEIGQYKGEVIGKRELYQRYHNGDAPYVIKVQKNTYVDARKSTSCLGRYLNHKPPRTANTEFVKPVGRRPKHVNIVSTKRIRPGQELFVNYGKNYAAHF